MTSAIPDTQAYKDDDRYSSVFLFFGIALIVLGMIAIIASVMVTIGTIMVLGGLLVAAGIAQLIHVFRAWHHTKILLNILSAILYLVAGGVLLYNPLLGALSLTLFMSAFFIVAGVLRCFYAIAHRKEPTWVWFLLGGIASLALGAMIALGWPVTGLWVIGLFVGIEMLTHGIGWMMLSVAVRGIEKGMV